MGYKNRKSAQPIDSSSRKESNKTSEKRGNKTENWEKMFCASFSIHFKYEIRKSIPFCCECSQRYRNMF